MKKFIITILALFISYNSAFAVKYEPVPSSVRLPAKYTQEYIDSISDEYKKVTKEQIFHVALDMMKGTTADFSRRAILGYNLTQYPIKIELISVSCCSTIQSSILTGILLFTDISIVTSVVAPCKSVAL